MYNTFLCDLYLEDKNNYFANYADDTTPYFVGSISENLSFLTKGLFSWFTNNQLIANDDKCHLILSSPEEYVAIQIEELGIKCLKVKKLLGIHIHYKIKFDTHVDTAYKKIHRKLNECVFKAQFNYCPVI